jgi:hypothetical protein
VSIGGRISFRQRRVWLGAVVAVVALVVLLLGFARRDSSSSGADANQESSEPVVFDQPEQTIQVGVHIVNIHQFSMRDKVYSVEGWYWLRWPETIRIGPHETDLMQIVEFKNSIEELDVELDSEQPEKLAGNRTFQRFMFSGRFYVDDLNLRKSPFQTIDLPVIVELRQLACNRQGPTSCTYLKPDPELEQAIVGEFAEINGFKLIGSSIKPSMHRYKTNFGEGPRAAYGRVEYSIRYRTEFWSAFIQNVLPVLIILAFVLVSPSLPSSMGDVRLAIPATALLTLIFMQQTYRSEIPSLSYLTFMDWLYAFAYIVSMSLFILFCWDTYRYTVAAEPDQPATAARIDRIDTAFQRLAIFGLGLTVVFGWVFTSSDRLA